MIFLGKLISVCVVLAMVVLIIRIFFEITNDQLEREDESLCNRPDLDFDLKELDRLSPPTLGTKIKDRPKFGD